MPTDLPPAVSLSEDNPPDVRRELEESWNDSVQDIWEKTKDVQAPTKDELKVRIAAERISRQMFLELESEGGRKRGGKKKLADLMASAVDEDGGLAKVKKTRTRKAKAKKTPEAGNAS